MPSRKAKGRNISHELKTPLAAIEGYALLLEEGGSSPELKEYARKISESSRQLSHMTGNILKLSRLEKQEILSDKEFFSLDEQLREAVLSLEPLWRAKNLDIDMELPEVTCYGNRELLYQVWTNIFGNAIKFTDRDGRISASIEETKDNILVIIRDTGIGMTEEARTHIFEKFYQAEESRHGEGSGLGLALAKKLLICPAEPSGQRAVPEEGPPFLWSFPAGGGETGR